MNMPVTSKNLNSSLPINSLDNNLLLKPVGVDESPDERAHKIEAAILQLHLVKDHTEASRWSSRVSAYLFIDPSSPNFPLEVRIAFEKAQMAEIKKDSVSEDVYKV